MTCADCRRTPNHGETFLGLDPGRLRNQPFWLCSLCWRESTKLLPPVERKEREHINRERQGSH